MTRIGHSRRQSKACLGLVALIAATAASPTLAQQVERRGFTIGAALKSALEAHQLDSGSIQTVADGVVDGISNGNAEPILEHAAAETRVTAGETNKVVGKAELAGYVNKLLATPRLREDVLDNDEVIIKDDEVGLARGTFWIRQRCLDAACTKKKSSIVTINLP